ncbi:Rha family transcriptional regulator [Bariatricus massiliensis]|uniref:Rha family transcriptional regulator n=1 Tax=Bariatricus massiliensis TaxID=1745713 RepID=A0ABS8DFK1_9FIRM|nr:Rha family transcriptional regulator [Bariatricus massiliensis]MCB7304088.1 Rha family transcriptional regulator [Bariatricus massiliensis]MCB7374481.1 Rha family transcriptional regulator [Bariatricus massiliensis]MCB7387198.1 Rha family transcriptional regulator [Bariatricus massiliensis]MCB7411360.1 Rha family transcriptional regulator [Bariatricus massiliensis]MCQ5252695.1 Rha family transcriptional regulator [Bariatricus massiliensis]
MKELIQKDEYGIFADTHDTARVDSLYVADYFEKSHNHVVRDIKKILSPQSGLSEEFNVSNFGRITYTDSRGRKQKAYAMTRDGFTMLVMGYTGAKAMKFKELYVKRFNEMEKFIKALVSARQEFPLLTANIKLLHDAPKPYHFSNECDMLNRIVLGMTAKQFRLANNIEKGKSIRPYLSKEQIDMLETLQKVDVGLLVAFPNYEDRKRHLEWYKTKLEEDK